MIGHRLAGARYCSQKGHRDRYLYLLIGQELPKRFKGSRHNNKNQKMRKAFFLLFLLSSVITFAQKSLYSDLNPNGSWYTDESRDAAYESSVSKLHKTWICCNDPNIESFTFKPNNVGNYVLSYKRHHPEEDFDYIFTAKIPFTYTKNKDKITVVENPLRMTVSIKPVETKVSQRIKDVIAKMEPSFTADLRKVKQITVNYTIYRIDDYLVIEAPTDWYPKRFVSKEHQAQAEARRAEQTKAGNKEE